MTAPASPADPSVARRGPVPGVLGRLASAVYGVAIRTRNARFDRGAGVTRLDRPVISVGNLSVGGTGKTPVVLHLVRALTRAGHRPAIAMRGYGAPAGDGLSSDEARAYRREVPEVPVVAQRDRVAGLRALFAEGRGRRIDCVVLDDGFQHRLLARELDIVLVDATRDPFLDRLLPAGWLREPTASLRRAHALVMTHAESVGSEVLERMGALLEGCAGGVPRTTCRHEWSSLARTLAGTEAMLPRTWLRGKRTFAACAIGNPGPFLRAAEEGVGGSLAGSMVLRDHDPFEARTVERLIARVREAGAEALLVTEKDWSKLSRVGAARWPCAVVRPRLELTFDAAGAALEAAVLAKVRGFRGGASVGVG